jgi:hypothetical protein
VERTVELSVQAGRLLHEIAQALAAGRAPALPVPDVDDGERWSRLPPIGDAPFPVGHQARQPRVRVPGGAEMLLDDLAGPWFSLVTRAGGPALDVPPFVRVLDASALDDVDGWLARLLGPHDALLVRPDRYVHAVGDDPRALLDALTRALRPPAGASRR